MSLVAIGACYVDTILTTPHYPSEDDKQRASNVTRRRGGNCPNTLEVLQQLTNEELELNLITVLPKRSSVASQQIISELEPDIHLDHCIFREQFEEPASCYIIKSLSTGSRTIVTYNELPDMTVAEFTQAFNDFSCEKTWFHFEGRTPDVTLGCIQYVRQRFPLARVSVEVERPGRPGLPQLAQEADVVFYSKAWAQSCGYTSTEEFLRQQSVETQGPSLLCCTWGEDGAGALMTDKERFTHVAAQTTENFRVVDPIGAGDTFIAGMLYALNCKPQWDLRRQLEFANHIAGLKVSQEGFSGLNRALGCYD
ncbi:pfkB family kinase [Penicillium taxi]|uniref:pfkB family kinase n=1 Tax=Penicillium taxi TaxID=168475 RepID=UPI002545AB20|nr:pfkB family kinase [Penicillium taxi]KAJ5887588.1 pfkB family kinase [Penicillium taxi]